MFKLIPLSKGKSAKVSPEDYEDLMRFKWSATCNPDGRTGEYIKWYAVRNDKGARVYMHRYLMKTPKGMVVDHEDRDGLNCTRGNMKNTFQRQNATRGSRTFSEHAAVCL